MPRPVDHSLTSDQDTQRHAAPESDGNHERHDNRDRNIDTVKVGKELEEMSRKIEEIKAIFNVAKPGNRSEEDNASDESVKDSEAESDSGAQSGLAEREMPEPSASRDIKSKADTELRQRRKNDDIEVNTDQSPVKKTTKNSKPSKEEKVPPTTGNPSQRVDASPREKKLNGGMKWLILAFVVTGVVFVGMFAAVFVELEKISETTTQIKSLCRWGQLAAAGLRTPELRTEIRRLLPHPISTTWIGLDDLASKGNYVWSDGVPSTRSNTDWEPGQPNNSYDRCAVIGSSRVWDKSCWFTYDYLCEF